MAQKFVEKGKYSFGFIGDADLKSEITVVKRTEKTVTIIDVHDKVQKRCKIHISFDGDEFIYPLGKYSMSPIAKASKKI